MSKPDPFFATPEYAEHAFYGAIGRGDLGGLMSVWSDEEDVVCIHPTGQKLHGLKDIREGWLNVLTQGLRVTPLVLHRWQTSVTAVYLVQETLYLGDDQTPHGPLLVTHVYIRGANGWRMVLHHAGVGAETVQDNRVAHVVH